MSDANYNRQKSSVEITERGNVKTINFYKEENRQTLGFQVAKGYEFHKTVRYTFDLMAGEGTPLKVVGIAAETARTSRVELRGGGSTGCSSHASVRWISKPDGTPSKITLETRSESLNNSEVHTSDCHTRVLTEGVDFEPIKVDAVLAALTLWSANKVSDAQALESILAVLPVEFRV